MKNRVLTTLFVLPVLMAAAASQAAIIPGTEYPNTPLIDTATGLGWLGFDTEGEGVAAGYRVATGQEFHRLMLHAGLNVLSPLPAPTDATVGRIYAKDGIQAISVPGVHVYGYSSGGSSEIHQNRFGWLREGDQVLLANIQYNYVPSQCPDDGSGGVSYCGGQFYARATMGTTSWYQSGQHDSWQHFDTMDHGYEPSAPGYLMVRAVPEPSMLVLVLAGGVAVGVWSKRRGR